MTTPGRSQSLLESFNFAFDGIIHVLRTQRNLRLHFLIAVAVIVAAVAFDVTRIELIALLISISFVLIAEMLNSRSRRPSTSPARHSIRSRSSPRTSPPVQS
jgi:diacylglycerol kinase